jgi:putative liporotein
MKMSKKIMAALFGAAMVVSCSSGGSDKVSSLSKESSISVTSTDTETSNTSASDNGNTANETPTTTETATAGSNKKTFVCGKDTVMVEYSADGNSVSLTNSKGTHELKRSVSGSGELYKDAKGLSIHMKGEEAVYKTSAKAKDVSCKAE